MRALLLFLLLSLPAAADALLVPIDDRPANLLFVRQIARIGGAQITPAPRHLLGRFLKPGDPEALADWLLKTARKGDVAFIASDMLLYGGLVASRNAAVSEDVALHRLSTLRQLAERDVRLHVLATIPRLSLRTSEAQAPFERKLSEWATKPGAPAPEGVPPEIVEEYLSVRRRNLAVNMQLAQLARQGVIEKLVIGQDDSHKTGLHVEEQQPLKDYLITGVDELTMDMVAGWMARGQGPTVRVIYSDPEAAEKVPPLESLPLGEMVRQHLVLAGARPLDMPEADVDLYIYVPSAKPWNVPGEEARPAAEAFVERVAAGMKDRQVAVADLSLVNRMDPFLAQAVIDDLPLPELEGFASWNTPANAVGTVIAQLVAHHVGSGLESEKTHQAFLLARMVDDFAYQTLVRDRVKQDVAGLPPDPDPLLNLYGPVGLDIRLQLIEFANRLYQEHFLGYPLCVEGRRVRLGPMDLQVVLPWPRIFEVEARLDLRLEVTGEDCGTKDEPPGRPGGRRAPRGR